MHLNKYLCSHLLLPPPTNSNVKSCFSSSPRNLPPLSHEDKAVKQEREKVEKLAGSTREEDYILTLDHVTRVYSSGLPWTRSHRAAVNQLCLAMQKAEVSCRTLLDINPLNT